MRYMWSADAVITTSQGLIVGNSPKVFERSETFERRRDNGGPGGVKIEGANGALSRCPYSHELRTK